MKQQIRFTIGIVRPAKKLTLVQTIKATDRAWRTAIFGMGGSRKRIGGARIGNLHGQPLAVIAELPEEVDHDQPHWAIETDDGLWAFIGPAAIYNDAGFGPATLALSHGELRDAVKFDLDVDALQDGLRRTLQVRGREEDGETMQ